MGGSGVQIPYNTFAWLAASLFVLVALLRVFLLKELRLHSSVGFYAGAMICLFSPLIYSDRLFLDVEVLRIIGMLSGLLFFVALQQFAGARFNSYLLWILLVSTMMQTVWGLVQYYFIYESSRFFWSAAEGSPYGVFQQVNVFSIYVAFGSMLVLWVFSSSRIRSQQAAIGVAGLIFANAHLAVLSEGETSRFVGFVSVLFYLLYLRARRSLPHKIFVFFALMLVLGSFLPKSLFDVRPELPIQTIAFNMNLAESEARNVAHSPPSSEISQPKAIAPYSQSILGTRPTIYQVSLSMFLDEPIIGHGIGSFRKQYLIYQGRFLEQNPSAPAEFNLGHPHNEPLYWMVELGALPGLGFLLILVGWVVGVRSGSLDLGVLLVALPLVMQSLLELPFYHSVAHYLSFFVIMVAAMSGKGMRNFTVPRWSGLIMGPLAMWSVWKAWVFLLSTYYALLMFLLFSASDREDVSYLLKVNNPSAFKLRYEFELFQWQLRRARRRGEIDIDSLNNYLRWAFSTIQYAPMQSTYENFAASLILIDNLEPARRFLDEGLLMYPANDVLKQLDRELAARETLDE